MRKPKVKDSTRVKTIKKISQKVLAGKIVCHNNMRGEVHKSECDTTLYRLSVANRLTHRSGSIYSYHTRDMYCPWLIIGEEGKWYASATNSAKRMHSSTILRGVIKTLPDVQIMSTNEMETLATHGITGLVLGLHERQGGAMQGS